MIYIKQKIKLSNLVYLLNGFVVSVGIIFMGGIIYSFTVFSNSYVMVQLGDDYQATCIYEKINAQLENSGLVRHVSIEKDNNSVYIIPLSNFEEFIPYGYKVVDKAIKELEREEKEIKTVTVYIYNSPY